MQEMKQKIIQYNTGNIKEIITIKRLESINNKAKRIRHNSLTGFSKKKYSFNVIDIAKNKDYYINDNLLFKVIGIEPTRKVEKPKTLLLELCDKDEEIEQDILC